MLDKHAAQLPSLLLALLVQAFISDGESFLYPLRHGNGVIGIASAKLTLTT